MAQWIGFQHPEMMQTQEASRSALMLSLVLWGALLVWTVAALLLLVPLARAFFF